MAKFLTTTGLSYHLEQLIKNAKERVILISPYLKVNDRLRELLEDRDRLKLDVRIVYGKNELQPDESEWLKDRRSIRLSFCKSLHAKCYMNEEEAIVTSMNLYEFSQVNNNEMGIYVTRSSDPELFREIYEECQRLVRTGDEVQISVEKVKKESGNPAKAAPAKEGRASGHCLRCGEAIPLNKKRPYCTTDYEKWAKYENAEYEDAFCHGCGKDHPASMKKPMCRDCYAKAV